MNKKQFYITTPIYYVNDRPHIGHAYTTVVADAYARFWREKLGKENVFFLTGTDEHGTKVAQSAAKAGLEPQAFTDQVSAEYKKVWAELGISYDEFFRTTDPAHKKVVGEFLTDLYNKGHIYKATYKGMYCVGCEKFLSFEDIVNGACVLHPNVPLVEQEEENYFFKLKEFSAQVLEKIEKEEIAVLPIERRNEILGKIKQGINDVSVSRPGVSWGIPLPWDEKHTVYVWVDALINYYSATKIFAGKDGESREDFWPPQVHIVGKDILWFHSLIWPGLLLARGLELPEHVVAHGFFTIDGQKMSKSLGNVINPLDLVAEYGVDAARYLIISAFPFGTDGDISLAKFKEKYNADLANGIGNLVARVAKLAEKLPKNPLSAEEIAAHTRGGADAKGTVAGATAEPTTGADALSTKITAHFEAHRPDLALQAVIDRVRELDQKIATEQPWKKDADTAEGLAELTALLKDYSAILLDIGTNLRPFLPITGERIVEIFSADNIAKPEKGLFERK